MSTQSGTASDYVDLLDKLDDFLTATGHAWGKRFTGVGTGDLTAYLGTAASVAETFTLTAINATTFSVVGSVSGALADATVGTPYTSAKLAFTLTAGGTAYQAGDVWTLNTAPPWQRLRREGWADSRAVVTNLQTWENLLDASLSTLATATATTTYMEWTMATPSRVRRILAQASSTPTRMPTTWVLQWKDAPGDAWTTAQTFTKTGWTDRESVQFITAADPGLHKYWRLDMSGATTSTEINSLRLFHATTAGVLGDLAADGYELAWRAPGLDGLQSIFCQARTEWVTASDVWNVAFGMSREWLADSPAANQPGTSGWRRMLLGTTPVAYWFIVNGQRATVVTSFQGVMQTAYMGFGNPYEPPSLHAYPAICGATMGQGGFRFSLVQGAVRSAWDPGTGGLNAPYANTSTVAYLPNSTWLQYANRYTTGSDPEGSYAGGSACGHVWPFGNVSSSVDASLSTIITNVDGSRPLIPCMLYSQTVGTVLAHAWGEFDGIFWTTGSGTAPQAVIRYESFDHLIVNNVFRTTSNNFAAIRLD